MIQETDPITPAQQAMLDEVVALARPLTLTSKVAALRAAGMSQATIDAVWAALR